MEPVNVTLMGTDEFPVSIKDLEIGRLSWNVWVGPTGNFMYTNKKEAKRGLIQTEEKKAV